MPAGVTRHIETLLPSGGPQALKISLSETVSPSESRGKKDDVKRTDSAAPADLKKLADLIKRAESLNPQESRVKRAGVKRTESQAVADSSRRADAVRRSDSFTPAELARRKPGLKRVEAFSAVEKLTRRAGVAKSETVVLQELLKRAWVARRQLNSQITAADALLFALGVHFGLSDHQALSDAVTHRWAAKGTLADTLGPSEARKLKAALRRSDQAAVIDVIRRNAGPHRHDAFSVAAAQRLAARKGISESFALVDVIHPASGISIGNLSEVSDALKVSWQAKRLRSDLASTSDALVRHLATRLAETILASEALHRHWKSVRAAADAFAVDDDIESFLGTLLTLSDSAALVDAFARVWAITIRRAEAVSGTDKARRDLRKALAEITFPQDARHSRFAEALEDALGSSDAKRLASQVRRKDLFALLDARRAGIGVRRHDASAVSDLVRRAASVSLSDRIVPLDGHLKNASLSSEDAITFADAISALHGLGVEIDEALAVADGLRRDSAIALLDLARITERVEPHGSSAHLAILALVDLLSTAAALEDEATTAASAGDELGVAMVVADERSDNEMADRGATTLSLEDGFA